MTATTGTPEVQRIPMLAPEPRYRRAVRLNLSPHMLGRMLGLPDDVVVTQVFVQQDPVSIAVIAEGDRFDAIPDGAQAPPLHPDWQVEQLRDEQGRLWQRIAWAEDASEVVHGTPPEGSGLTPCCGRTTFELPRTDRLSIGEAVTCRGRS